MLGEGDGGWREVGAEGQDGLPGAMVAQVPDGATAALVEGRRGGNEGHEASAGGGAEAGAVHDEVPLLGLPLDHAEPGLGADDVGLAAGHNASPPTRDADMIDPLAPQSAFTTATAAATAATSTTETAP